MRVVSILLLIVLSGLAFGCGDDSGDDDEKCPSFADQQLLPESGGADTEFVMWVRLRSKDVNRNVDRVYAESFYADGRSNNLTLDLVRVEGDRYTYLRTFDGADVCDAGTCTLFFRVVAEHEDGCEKSFETSLFQVTVDDTAE